MKKAISYALFGADNPMFKFYARGLFYNLRMNKLIYPDWQTVVYCSKCVVDKMKDAISEFYFPNATLITVYEEPKLCEGMLWRMLPLKYYDYVIMRDCDAITTWREKKSVDRWIESGKVAHGINDNKVHSIPLMGGMMGMRGGTFSNSFPMDKQNDYDLRIHGTDQQFIGDHIYPLVKDSIYIDNMPQADYSSPLWESDLTCRHIGSAGVVEMELTRFFRRFEPKEENERNEIILKKYFNDIL